MQMDMLDMLEPPLPKAIYRPVDPDGSVVQVDVDETLTLQKPRMAWDSARIELHRHEGLWMWSSALSCDGSGRSYRVGPKWGNFARTRGDALVLAINEIRTWLRDRTEGVSPDGKRILAWLSSLN